MFNPNYGCLFSCKMIVIFPALSNSLCSVAEAIASWPFSIYTHEYKILPKLLISGIGFALLVPVGLSKWHYIYLLK